MADVKLPAWDAERLRLHVGGCSIVHPCEIWSFQQQQQAGIPCACHRSMMGSRHLPRGQVFRKQPLFSKLLWRSIFAVLIEIAAPRIHQVIGKLALLARRRAMRGCSRLALPGRLLAGLLTPLLRATRLKPAAKAFTNQVFFDVQRYILINQCNDNGSAAVASSRDAGNLTQYCLAIML